MNAFEALMSGARASAQSKSQLNLRLLLAHPRTGEPEPEAKRRRMCIYKRRETEEDIKELEERISFLKKKPAVFDPSGISYWEKDEPVPFRFLSFSLNLMEGQKARVAITDVVCNMLRVVMYTTPSDLLHVVDLLANKIYPDSPKIVKLGIGETIIIKALADACGKGIKEIEDQYDEKGDLGLVAMENRASQPLLCKTDPLTVRQVLETFRRIGQSHGRRAQREKENLIKKLIRASVDCECLYLIRLLQSNLKIGCGEQTLLAALGQAAVYAGGSPPTQSSLEEAVKIVKQVYSVLPLYGKIIPVLLDGGLWKLPETCNFTLGVLVEPMLSKAANGVSEVVNKFQDVEFTCEYKYDGVRAQIHYMDDGSVWIYSRNAELNTEKFPDVADAISRLKRSSVSSFVLDCELVAYDRKKMEILDFQVLSTRGRKGVLRSDIKVNVCIYAFDILYLNGKPLLQEILKVRREHLYASFEEEPGFLQFATAITSSDVEEIQKFLDEAVDAKCEGLIIKTLHEDATYEPSKRSLNWLKLKKDYLNNMGDSLDLVPIAAFHGRGTRTGVYGAFLLACYDSDNEEFQSICKIGTGFSVKVLQERSDSLRSKVIPKAKPYYQYAETIKPDVWFEASEVWEVKAADLTISPIHRAAIGTLGSAWMEGKWERKENGRRENGEERKWERKCYPSSCLDG